MKRSIIFFIFAIIFISLVSSIPQIKFQNEEIQPGETILATIEVEEGNFTNQIENSHIKFFEGRKEIFIESKVIFYKGKHYFYAYPNREGNFTMKISNILYKEGEQLSSSNIEKTFSVSKNIQQKDNTTFTEILSIKPGFSFLEKNPKIKITNLGDVQINFSVKQEESKEEKVSLNPFETKEFVLSPSSNFSYFQINSYNEFKIPIISTIGEIYVEKNESYLKTQQEMILKNLIVGEEYNETISFFNLGNEQITNISVTSDIDFLDLREIKEIGNFSPRESRNVSIYLKPKNPGSFKGTINIAYKHSNKTGSLEILLNLFVLPEGSAEENFTVSQKTCEEIEGKVCSLEEICAGESRFTKGGEYCCLGECEEIEENEEGGFNWIIGILIILVLGGGGYYLYKKSKKVNSGRPDEKIKEISDNYNKRMKGTPFKK